MMHYNNDNNAYCSAVNTHNFETREQNTVQISTFLYTRNLYSYSHLEIFICIYSVRGGINQISTNTFRYTTCCPANVYMFVYISLGAPIVPLKLVFFKFNMFNRYKNNISKLVLVFFLTSKLLI